MLYDSGICSAPDEEGVEDSYKDEADAKGDQSKATAVSSAAAGGAAKDEKGGEEVSLYRKELAVIQFNSRTRPTTTRFLLPMILETTFYK